MADPRVKLPEKYSEARKALAAAIRIDEVKHIRNVAEAMRVYAYQARDGQLAGDAVEIKKRATRKLGDLMEQQRQTGKLAKGVRGHGRPTLGGVSKTPPKEETLADQGIDKNLAKLARSEFKKPEAKFETDVAKARRIANAAAEGNTQIVKAAKAERHAEKRASRAVRELALALKITALPQKRYAVIYADPEWRFETYSPEGKLDTSAENHYPTSSLDDIKARDVPSISAPDAVLFLWATVPMLPQALEVMAAWGFGYVSHCAWVKDRTGTGYWFLNKHELLLVGTRGHIPAPAQGDQWASVIEAPRGRHSEKPEIFYELIESYFPRTGWDSWGLEAPMLDAAQ